MQIKVQDYVIFCWYCFFLFTLIQGNPKQGIPYLEKSLMYCSADDEKCQIYSILGSCYLFIV